MRVDDATQKLEVGGRRAERSWWQETKRDSWWLESREASSRREVGVEEWRGSQHQTPSRETRQHKIGSSEEESQDV